MKQIFSRAAGWFGKWRRSQVQDQPIIGASRTGLWVVNPSESPKGQITLAPWKSIVSVVAFSRNEGAESQVCVKVTTDQGSLNLNEDMENWAEALAAMELRLSDFPRTSLWLMDVAYPGTDSGETHLWHKPEARRSSTSGSRRAVRSFPAPQSI